jgi:hypothetical protein
MPKAKTSLRRKYINSTLVNKKCEGCGNVYPRTLDYFYPGHRPHSYNNKCITCCLNRVKEWKLKNRSSYIQKQYRYKETEEGYFGELFNNMKKSNFYCEFKDRNEVINHWREQQKIYGNKCPATGVEMTRIRGRGRGVSTGTNISKDRILTSKGYTKQNTIFVCWDFNNTKGSINPKLVKIYLKIVKERYGTDDIE